MALLFIFVHINIFTLLQKDRTLEYKIKLLLYLKDTCDFNILIINTNNEYIMLVPYPAQMSIIISVSSYVYWRVL